MSSEAFIHLISAWLGFRLKIQLCEYKPRFIPDIHKGRAFFWISMCYIMDRIVVRLESQHLYADLLTSVRTQSKSQVRDFFYLQTCELVDYGVNYCTMRIWYIVNFVDLTLWKYFQIRLDEFQLSYFDVMIKTYANLA